MTQNASFLKQSFWLTLNCTAKMKIERDNCLRLQCEVKTNDHWVSFLGYHFNLIGWKVWTGKCILVKGVSKQPLLLLSSMLWGEKQATPRFLPAAGLLRVGGRRPPPTSSLCTCMLWTLVMVNTSCFYFMLLFNVPILHVPFPWASVYEWTEKGSTSWFFFVPPEGDSYRELSNALEWW